MPYILEPTILNAATITLWIVMAIAVPMATLLVRMERRWNNRMAEIMQDLNGKSTELKQQMKSMSADLGEKMEREFADIRQEMKSHRRKIDR